MIRTSLCFATALLAGLPGALAQDYPTRFVTIVAPFQAGGPSDTVARLIAIPMSKALGQQVVVENVTGAGGTLGSSRVAKAAPDGYTLGISGSPAAFEDFMRKEVDLWAKVLGSMKPANNP